MCDQCFTHLVHVRLAPWPAKQTGSGVEELRERKYLSCNGAFGIKVCSFSISNAEIAFPFPHIRSFDPIAKGIWRICALHSYPALSTCPKIYHKVFIHIPGSVKVQGTWKTHSQCLVYSRPHLQVLKNCHFTMKREQFFSSIQDFHW